MEYHGPLFVNLFRKKGCCPPFDFVVLRIKIFLMKLLGSLHPFFDSLHPLFSIIAKIEIFVKGENIQKDSETKNLCSPVWEKASPNLNLNKTLLSPIPSQVTCYGNSINTPFYNKIQSRKYSPCLIIFGILHNLPNNSGQELKGHFFWKLLGKFFFIKTKHEKQFLGRFYQN